MNDTATIPFDNTYARLPEGFFARVAPTPVEDPRLIRLNRPLAEALGLDADALSSPTGAAILAGNRIPDNAEPLAMAYAGHQFGNWVPQLGDGRAVLLGEVIDRDGVRRDIQLKGAGRTPFSRMGDGRAGMDPVIKEYLGSEAMHALGIRTTRSLAMVTTGETIYRRGPERGAVLVRVARSHVRVGTFEYFARRGDQAAVKTLADYVIERHYPDLAGAEQPYRALFDTVMQETAGLIASWMMVGFIHGVMNTDNISLAAETIDYGPFAFMDTYHPAKVFSSIDHGGRYAFNQQPGIAQWDLARLAETLLPLLDDNEEQAIAWAEEALGRYREHFQRAYHGGLRRKLGLAEEREGDVELAHDLLMRMYEQEADYTLTFRRLSDLRREDTSADEPVRALFNDPARFDEWATQWRERLSAEGHNDAERIAAMRATNPAYVLRNHLAVRAIDAAQDHDDYSVMDDLLTVLTAPFEDHPGYEHYARPPRPEEAVTRTFCGT